jgi:hypothetical protein
MAAPFGTPCSFALFLLACFKTGSKDGMGLDLDIFLRAARAI